MSRSHKRTGLPAGRPPLRGHCALAELAEDLDYAIDGRCAFCERHETKANRKQHEHCEEIALRQHSGKVFKCKRENCAFYTTSRPIFTKHVMNSRVCVPFYEDSFGSSWCVSLDLRDLVIPQCVKRVMRSPGPDRHWLIPPTWDSSYARRRRNLQRLRLRKKRAHMPDAKDDSTGADSPRNKSTTSVSATHDNDGDEENRGDNRGMSNLVHDQINDPDDDEDNDCAKSIDGKDDDADFDSDFADDIAAVEDCNAENDLDSASAITVVIDEDICNEMQGSYLQGAKKLADYLEKHHVDLDASRRDHLTQTKGLHDLSVFGVEICAELGASMLSFNTFSKTYTAVLSEVLAVALEKNLCTPGGAAMIEKRMRHRPLHKVRENLCSAAKGYIGRVFAFVFSMHGICEHVPGSSSTHTVRLRDPVILIHDMLNATDALSPGETLHIFAKPQAPVLTEFCDGKRCLQMQTLVRERARLAAVDDPQTWEAVDIDQLAALPIGVYMDATHATKTGSVVKCPLVVFTYWHARDALQRDGAKRILGYVELPAKGRPTAWRAALERAKEQCVLDAVFHLVAAWQRLAFKRGGLSFHVGERQVRAVPVLAAILGDNKESNRLSCTFETTRCRLCCADRAIVRDGVAMPLQPPRNLETLKEKWKQLQVQPRRESSAVKACSSTDFGPIYGMHPFHVGDRNALITTDMDFFAQPTSIYRMLPFDRLHTLWKGPVSELVIAVLCSAGRERRAFLAQLKLCQGGMPSTMTVTTEKLQNYLLAAGLFPVDALHRPKYNAKDYIKLMHGILSGYVHDILVGKTEKHKVLNLRSDFRILVWALAAAARVCHEFGRQRVATAAIPAMRRDVRALVTFQQRYRITFEQTNVTTLKAHGLLHMVDQIEFFGPLDLTDTASFEHHHLKVARQAKLVNHGLDISDTWMLRRAIEHESAQNRNEPARRSRPRANRHDHVVGGATGKPDHVAEPKANLGAGVDQTGQLTPCEKVAKELERIALANGCAAATGDSFAALLHACMEPVLGNEHTIEVFSKADLAGSKRQLALGAGSGKWAKVPPSVLITEIRDLFLPLAFVRKKRRKLGKCQSGDAKVIAIQIARDSKSHDILSRHTYLDVPLSGFCVVDLAAATRSVSAESLAMLDLDKVGGGETLWLNPSDAQDRRAILWPHGSLAFGSWQAHPFACEAFGNPDRGKEDLELMNVVKDNKDDTVAFNQALEKIKNRLDPDTGRLIDASGTSKGKRKRKEPDSNDKAKQ